MTGQAPPLRGDEGEVGVGRGTAEGGPRPDQGQRLTEMPHGGRAQQLLQPARSREPVQVCTCSYMYTCMQDMQTLVVDARQASNRHCGRLDRMGPARAHKLAFLVYMYVPSSNQ